MHARLTAIRIGNRPRPINSGVTANGDSHPQQAARGDGERSDDGGDNGQVGERPQQDHQHTDARAKQYPDNREGENSPPLAMDRRLAAVAFSLLEPDFQTALVQSWWFGIRHLQHY